MVSLKSYGSKIYRKYSYSVYFWKKEVLTKKTHHALILTENSPFCVKHTSKWISCITSLSPNESTISLSIYKTGSENHRK